MKKKKAVTVTVEMANLMQKERNAGMSLDEISSKYMIPKWVVSRYTRVNPLETKTTWTVRQTADVWWEWDFWTQFVLSGGKYRG